MRQAGDWLERRKTRDAPHLLYGALCGMSLWPVLEAAQAGELLPAIMTLGGIVGGVGSNLLAEQIQRWIDRADEAEVAEWVAEHAPDDPDLREALDAILEQLDVVAQVRAGLSESDRQWFAETLREELAQLGNLARFEGAIHGDVVIGDKSTTFDQRKQHVEQQFNVAGDLIQRIESGPQVLDEYTALNRYLHYVIEANRRLRLQGIRSSSGLVSIDLEEIYVTLSASDRRTTAAEESIVEEMAGMAPGEAQRITRMGVDRSRGMMAQVRVKVQDALAAHPRLVVLGDPGCGKTTLLRYLALTFARNLSGEKGLVKRRLQLQVSQEGMKDSKQEEQRLPILLPLRDFARYLETKHPDPSTDGPTLLLEYLRTYFSNQDIPLPKRFFAERLLDGECAVLLDGVDEVADFGTRHRVARIIELFTIAYPDNRYVITSRIVGYTGSARLSEGYAMTTVRDFTRADIERFVTHWNHAVEVSLAGVETPYVLGRARRQTEALLRAIENNERIRELAVNPLLLTVIALVQRYRAQLPERRTELYEEAIEVLLG